MKTNTFNIIKKVSSFIFIFLFINSIINAQYCEPSTDCTDSHVIENFYTENANIDISNLNSGCNDATNGYTYFAGTTVQVDQYSSFDINVQTEGSYSEGFGIWIDYNQDGDFDDLDEFAYASPSAGTGLYEGTINLPN